MSGTGILCRGRLIFQSLFLGRVHNYHPTLTSVRSGHYSSDYIEPTIDKLELEIPLAQTDPRLFKQIKASKNEQRTSLTYNPDIEKFINILMRDGKKAIMREVVYKSLEKVKRIQIQKYHAAKSDLERNEIELNPQKVFSDAIDNCKPLLRLVRVKRGGSNYEVPVACDDKQQTFRAMKFIISTCGEKQRDVRLYDKIAYELIAASKHEGSSIKKKNDLHKRCEANKAYVTYNFA